MKIKALLLSAILMASALCGQAQLQPVAYRDGTQQLNGFLARPGKPQAVKAGILILPAWMGIDQHSKAVAEQLAGMGYYAFVADIYGEGHYPQTPKEAGTQSAYYKQHVAEYQQRIRLALEQLRQAGAAEVVVIGYCFGGAGALEAARVNLPVKGIVSFHGAYGRDPARKIEPIRAKVLILHGADDPYSSAEDIRNLQDELRKAKADWQMVYYSGAVHAFTDPGAGNDNSKGAAYNKQADQRSWQAMLQFLKETL
ncbi:dienelactone hydrolase family protein [Taibaiella koreensis]|uniref:dienelactone hydrolase family protein n=1 Tax=Taibaiella koreensis TaxID=1268548 RepID=UPI000E59FB6F|nr:dienelactone hydrolase family protein [Taibaiella koreensis]